MNKKFFNGYYPSLEKMSLSRSTECEDQDKYGSSYRLAFQDPEFLLRQEMRPIRLYLEMVKPELLMQDHGIESTVVFFGSARTLDPETAKQRVFELQEQVEKDPGNKELRHKLARAKSHYEKSGYYEEARKLSRMISGCTDRNCLVAITGGGGGIMEAANKGAWEVGAPSIGLNIVLPREQVPNEYIPSELNFQMHYFAIRKMHFLMRAKGLVAFPGGFGTLDEVFETLTLLQTNKIDPIPVILFGRQFWDRVVNFQTLVEEGTIEEEDLDLFQYVESAEEAWEIISRYNGLQEDWGGIEE